jgi:uncharacterized membrane protein
MSDERIPAGAMFKSFLIVAGGAFFIFMAFGGIFWLLARQFYPETLEVLTTQRLTVQEMLEGEKAIPDGLLWGTIGLVSLICFGVGWGVARMVPFAREAHAFFLAVVLLVVQAQNLFGHDGARSMPLLVSLIAFPAAVLLGARRVTGAQVTQPSGNDS